MKFNEKKKSSCLITYLLPSFTGRSPNRDTSGCTKKYRLTDNLTKTEAVKLNIKKKEWSDNLINAFCFLSLKEALVFRAMMKKRTFKVSRKLLTVSLMFAMKRWADSFSLIEFKPEEWSFSHQKLLFPMMLCALPTHKNHPEPFMRSGWLMNRKGSSMPMFMDRRLHEVCTPAQRVKSGPTRQHESAACTCTYKCMNMHVHPCVCAVVTSEERRRCCRQVNPALRLSIKLSDQTINNSDSSLSGSITEHRLRGRQQHNKGTEVIYSLILLTHIQIKVDADCSLRNCARIHLS